jgi:hypothetical protein
MHGATIKIALLNINCNNRKQKPIAAADSPYLEISLYS